VPPLVCGKDRRQEVRVIGYASGQLFERDA
jgi:hypothetical protein